MFTLVIERDSVLLRRRMRRYLAAALFVLVFGLIYERFSHGVYSGFMLFAFTFPLAGGALPCLLLERFAKKQMPGKLLFRLNDFGISAWTVGSVMRGILDIYGTTNRLTAVYWYAGGGFLAAAVFLYLIACFFGEFFRKNSGNF